MQKLSLVYLAIIAFAACGSSTRSAEDQCNDLLLAICKRAQTCLEKLAGEKAPSRFRSLCVSAIQDAALGESCSHAVDVTDNYDQCIDEIESASCDEYILVTGDAEFTIAAPDSCSRVIALD